VADLKPADVQVWFNGAPGSILALTNAVSKKSPPPDTDILYVVAPFYRLNKDEIGV
jgi:hypothetical protein